MGSGEVRYYRTSLVLPNPARVGGEGAGEVPNIVLAQPNSAREIDR